MSARRHADPNRHYIIGAEMIGEALGYSGRTIRRFFSDGILKVDNLVFQTGAATSPLKMRRNDIPRALARLRRRGRETKL